VPSSTKTHDPGIRSLDLAGLSLESSRRDDELVVSFSGELDMTNAERVSAGLVELEAAGPGAILLDLTKLVFIDSTGLRVLVDAYTRARASDRRLTMLPATSHAQRVFEVSGLADTLPFGA
jgi:anti-sigma B factor antagonist